MITRKLVMRGTRVTGAHGAGIVIASDNVQAMVRWDKYEAFGETWVPWSELENEDA